MPSIKRTAPKPPPASSRNVSSCGPATPTERAASSCGGWVSKGSRGKKTEKQPKADKVASCGSSPAPRKSATVSSCGGAGWSRYGKIPSSC